MAVTVHLRGGLGNQLFLYAAGYAMSKRLDVPLLLDLSLLPDISSSNGEVSRWPEQISLFNHEGTFIFPTQNKILKRLKESFLGVERQLGDRGFSGLVGKHVYAYEANESFEKFLSANNHFRINAYCTGYKYFSSSHEEIARQIWDVRNPSQWYIETSQEIKSIRPIAVHVRWGDYKNLKHVYGEISPNYYVRATERISNIVGNRPIWLFSDQPTETFNFLKQHLNIQKVVQPSGDSTPLENLLLLAQAEGLVAANSTFSWWAAFLSGNPGDNIIFPRPLYAVSGPPEPKEWLLPDWNQIGR